ncbi:MAG: metalloregulator ArsR/SmtB family transcription factor [Myxococcota bacterium]
MTEALDVLGDPVRRRLLEVLALGSQSAGALGEVIREEFGISQSAVSQHLKVLRQRGFVSVSVQGRSRIYHLEEAPLRAAEAWFEQLRSIFGEPLEALATEVERGKRETT